MPALARGTEIAFEIMHPEKKLAFPLKFKELTPKEKRILAETTSGTVKVDGKEFKDIKRLEILGAAEAIVEHQDIGDRIVTTLTVRSQRGFVCTLYGIDSLYCTAVFLKSPGR